MRLMGCTITFWTLPRPAMVSACMRVGGERVSIRTHKSTHAAQSENDWPRGLSSVLFAQNEHNARSQILVLVVLGIELLLEVLVLGKELVQLQRKWMG
jgi:hypothetical protein